MGTRTSNWNRLLLWLEWSPQFFEWSPQWQKYVTNLWVLMGRCVVWYNRIFRGHSNQGVSFSKTASSSSQDGIFSEEGNTKLTTLLVKFGVGKLDANVRVETESVTVGTDCLTGTAMVGPIFWGLNTTWEESKVWQYGSPIFGWADCDWLTCCQSFPGPIWLHALP